MHSFDEKLSELETAVKAMQSDTSIESIQKIFNDLLAMDATKKQAANREKVQNLMDELLTVEAHEKWSHDQLTALKAMQKDLQAIDTVEATAQVKGNVGEQVAPVDLKKMQESISLRFRDDTYQCKFTNKETGGFHFEVRMNEDEENGLFLSGELDADGNGELELTDDFDKQSDAGSKLAHIMIKDLKWTEIELDLGANRILDHDRTKQTIQESLRLNPKVTINLLDKTNVATSWHLSNEFSIEEKNDIRQGALQDRVADKITVAIKSAVAKAGDTPLPEDATTRLFENTMKAQIGRVCAELGMDAASMKFDNNWVQKVAETVKADLGDKVPAFGIEEQAAKDIAENVNATLETSSTASVSGTVTNTPPFK